jgi:ribosomal protein L23
MATDLKAKYAGILIRPRITEKANFVVGQNIHTFEVAQKATKASVSAAIKAFYKVVPTKVNIVKSPSKTVFVRGKKDRLGF